MSGNSRSEKIEKKAASIIETMPALPAPDDSSSVKEHKVSRYRAWVKKARGRAGGDSDLAERVVEMMRERMGVEDGNPSADLNAMNLMDAGMGEVGLTHRASAALDEAGVHKNGACNYLLEEYVKNWREHGAETLLFRANDIEDLCVGLRDAIRVNIWVAGEPNMPSVSEQDAKTVVRRKIGD